MTAALDTSKPSQDEWDSGVPVGPSEDEWAAGVVVEVSPPAPQPGLISDITTIDLSGVNLNRPRPVYEPSGMAQRFGVPAQRPIPVSSYAQKDYEQRITGTPADLDARTILEAIPFGGGINRGLDAQKLQEATIRAKEGNATSDDLQALKIAQLDATRGMTTPAQIGTGIAGSVRLGAQAAIGSVAGPVGALAGMAADPGTIMSRYAAQQTPETAIETVDGKPTGNIILGAPPSDSQKEAIAKVAMLQASDSIIEMLGGKAANAALGAVGGAAVKQLAKRAPATSKAVQAFAKRYGESSAAQMLDRAQIQGIAPEYLEEVMQSAAAAGIGEPGADPTALLDPSDPEAFNTMMVIGVLNSPRLLGMFQKVQSEKESTQGVNQPDLAMPPDEQDFTDVELMALFAGEQTQPTAPQQTPFAPIEGQRLPADTLTMPTETGTPFAGIPAQPRQSTAAPAIEQAQPQPMQRPTSFGATPRFTAQQVEGVPQVESVPFGTQEDRRMSPLEALGRLAGVDMSQPAEASDQLVNDTITAMSTPRPQQAKPVPVRAVEALYEMAGDKGELTITAMDESIADFVDAFEPSERRQALDVWSKVRDEVEAMPEGDLDAWASQLLGRQSAATEPAPTEPAEAAPDQTTPTPVQTEIVAPRATQEPISATVEPVAVPASTKRTRGKKTQQVARESFTDDFRDAHANIEDPFVKNDILRLAARKQKTDKDMADILDRIDPSIGSLASNTAYDVSKNPASSEATKARAKQIMEDVDRSLLSDPEPAPITAKPKRTPPPAKGSTSATGWTTVAKGVARKDMMGSTVEIVRQADGTWSVTRDEKEMDSGYKSRAEAERYADGELAQDIRDQQNAEEEDERGVVEEPKKAPRPQKTLLEQSIQDMEESDMPESVKQRIRDNLKERETRRKGKPKGPAPADTGIFRDLTAAARAGQRFVEDLHVRIAPTLARIHAAAKSPVEFVRSAVAKIGEHIRPYARRFLADVRKVNAEFAANPTRGSVPSGKKPLGKRELEAEYRAGVRDEKRATKAEKVLSSREATAEGKEATKAASEAAFAEGRKLGFRMGGMRSKDELKALTKKMREVVPPKLRALRERAVARALADNTLSQEKREKKIGGIIEAVRRDVMKYEGMDGVEKALAKVKRALPSMEGSLRKFATDLINSFDVSAPTTKTLEAAEELMSGLADGTIQDGTVNPRAVEKAQRTIENFVSGRNLKSMPLAEVRHLRNILERIEAWHQGGLKAVKERLTNDRKDIDQTADEVMADAKKSYPAGEFKDTMSFIQAKENVPMSLRNLVGLLGPKGSRIVKRFVDAFDEGERKTARVRHDAHRHMLNGLAEIGLLKDKGQGVYEATDELLAMSPFITGVASRGPAGRYIGKKLGQAQPEYQEFGGVKYTTGERIKLYNLSRDPDARHALVKGKGSDTVFARNDEFARMDYDTLDNIVNSLNAKERKIADLMFEYNNGKLRDQMNEAWNAMYGHDIFTETNHESMRRRMIGEEPDARAKKLGNSYTENMGILKARQGGNQPIVIDDAFAEFFSHVNKVAMAVGQMQASMDARRAMSTPALEQAIKRSHPRGNAFLRELSERIDEYGAISAKGVDEVEAGARIFLNNMTGTMVATSPAALITTPMSIPSAQSVIPLSYLLANTRPSTGKAEFAEIEKESPTLYAIITDTGHRVTTPEAAGIGVQRFYGNQKNTVSERITTVLRKLNDQAVYAIWRSAKQWGEAQGLKGEALMDFTARKAEEAYSRSQPDNTFTNQSGAKLRARKSLWYTLGTAFQGQTQKAWNQALEARNDYRWSKGTAEDKAKYARDVFFPVILQTLLYRGTATAVMYALAAAKYDERKMSEMEKDFWADIGMEGVLDVISQIPMVGGMLSDPMRMAYNGLTGKPKWSGTSSILARTGEEIEKAAYGAGRGLRKLFTGNGEFDPDSIADPILFLGQVIGVPAKPLKDLKEMVVGAD